MKKIVYMVILSMMVIIAAGCQSPTTQSKNKTSDTSNNNAIIAYVGTAIFDSSLDPIKGAMSYGYSFTNSALIKVDTDSNYIGDMATEWEISEDGLKYTFNIRENVKFSDGSDMTAKDIVFTYEQIKNNQAENENVDLTRLESVTSIGDHQVIFTLSQPFSPFLDITSMVGIVPSSSYDSAQFDYTPIGTGPWKVIQYYANQQIIVEPNEYYYDGIPSIDRVTLVYLNDETALAAAKSGQLDVVMVGSNYSNEQVDNMAMIPLETMDIRMISLPVNTESNYNGTIIGNNVTSDINVRKALSIGIDRQTIINHALGGIGKPATSFTNNLIWSDNNQFDDNKVEEAKEILENAGWIDSDNDGIREKAGIKCEFDIYTTEDRYPLATALAENALELGIKINSHSSNWDEISSKMNSQGVVWGWGQFSPTVISSLFKTTDPDGSYDNVVGYSNDNVDTLIDNALGSTNHDDAIKYWKEAQMCANNDYPYLYIVNIEHSYFVSNRLDISINTQIPHPHGHGSPIICNMKDWTIK